jgi:hypothetical protein
VAAVVEGGRLVTLWLRTSAGWAQAASGAHGN